MLYAYKFNHKFIDPNPDEKEDPSDFCDYFIEDIIIGETGGLQRKTYEARTKKELREKLPAELVKEYLPAIINEIIDLKKPKVPNYADPYNENYMHRLEVMSALHEINYQFPRHIEYYNCIAKLYYNTDPKIALAAHMFGIDEFYEDFDEVYKLAMQRKEEFELANPEKINPNNPYPTLEQLCNAAIEIIAEPELD